MTVTSARCAKAVIAAIQPKVVTGSEANGAQPCALPDSAEDVSCGHRLNAGGHVEKLLARACNV